MHYLRTFLIASIGIFLLASIGLAEEQTLAPAKDNTLFEDSEGELSNGAGETMFAGRTGTTTGGLIRRAVIAFDLTTIPPGSTVTGVELTLQESNPRDAGTQTVTVHRLLKDWGEGDSDGTENPAGPNEGDGAQATSGDATWIHTFFDTQFWDSAGGDFAGDESASTAVTNGSQTWGSTDQLVADVQAWVDDPSSNFGWILIGNEDTIATAKRFDSRTGTTPPQLTVEYDPPQQELTNQIYFPQFATGDGFFSEITLINPNAGTAATAQLVILEQDGQLLPVTLNGNPTPGELEVVIPPNGRRILATDATGELVVGSVTVNSDQPLSGVIVFAGPFGLSGVQATDDFSDGFIGPAERELPSVRGRDVRSGIAIQNLEEESKTIVLELLDVEGTLLATAEVNLPALGQTSLFVDEFDWTAAVDFTDFQGSIRVDTGDDLAAVMIQTRPGQFATLPVEDLVTAAAGP